MAHVLLGVFNALLESQISKPPVWKYSTGHMDEQSLANLERVNTEVI